MDIEEAGKQIDAGYRLEMLIEQKAIIENKVVEQVLPIHEAQLFNTFAIFPFEFLYPTGA